MLQSWIHINRQSMTLNLHYHMPVYGATENGYVMPNQGANHALVSGLVAMLKLGITVFVPQDIGYVLHMW